MARHRVVLSLIAIGLAFTGSLFLGAQEKKPSPRMLLLGKWRADISATQSITLEFREDIVEMKIEAGGAVNGIITATAVLPEEHADRHMDWVGMRAGERALPDNKILYKIVGDTMLLIGGGPKDRPASFYSGPGSEPKAFILTRIPAKQAKE